ncbi:uncharacterized protein LOC131938658 [Physella acuta]|uniref:uncharacterized protein LOC131938658 n=1 Tax=Physella acuta TaxID=109671 RepID=UPI0027DB493E|nr:uncharacterized protein LOC131938658 [Physella acuta]
MASGDTANTPEGSRSFLVDEAAFEERFLRCGVCHEKFDQAEHTPKSLPCNHTFCTTCLTQIYDHANGQPENTEWVYRLRQMDGLLKCPTCRVEIHLQRDDITELPNDHRIFQMTDFISQAMAKTSNLCAKHESQPLNFFCKKCMTPICRDCTVLDHKETDGHVIIDLADAMRENSAVFTDVENRSKQYLEKMKRRSDHLGNASKRLDMLERKLKQQVRENFIEYKLLLDKRQEYLNATISQIIKEHKTKINNQFANICGHGTELQKLYDLLKASKSSNDIRKILSICQQIKDREDVFKESATKDDTELFQSCEFEAVNEGTFLSDLSGLGEVRSRADPGLKLTVSVKELQDLEQEQERERQRYRELFSPEIDRQASHPMTGDDPDDDDEDLDYHERFLPGSILAELFSSQILTADDEGGRREEGRNSARRSTRHGRRPRDTNSSQVSMLFGQTPEGVNPLARGSAPAALRPEAGPQTHRHRLVYNPTILRHHLQDTAPTPPPHPAPTMEGPMLNAHTEMTLSKDLEETFLTCSICGEPFNQSDRSPKLLTCNHTFCQMCLVTQSGGRGDLYCPMCRAVTHLSGDVCKLPVDHKVNQIRDCVDDIKHQQKNICPQHEFQYLSFFCQKCFVPVCRDCTVLDHTTDKGHVICDVKSALKSYSDLMDAAEKSAQLTLEKMAAEKEKHEQEVVAMENMKEEVTNEIVAKFSELHQYLEQRQSSLIAEVNTFVDHATAGEQTRGEIVGAKRRQLEDLLKEFQASRQNKVTAKIFRGLRQIREVSEAHLELLDILQDPDKRCSFEACKEEELICHLTDFGEVRAALKTDMVKPGDQN